MFQDDDIGKQPYRLVRQFRSLSEDRPGAAWQHVVNRGWPGWRDWYALRGGSRTLSLEDGTKALRRHMPELEKMIGNLSALHSDDPLFAEFLGFWCPPRYLVNCSQAVAEDQDGPFLIRNYDLDPMMTEATLLRSAWRGKRVMGMVEGLSGVSDGMNENGLTVSLTFGGRVVVGRGFGIPLIMRYLLEVCTDTQDVIEALRSIPCHMSYNVTAIDIDGNYVTAFLSPDRPPMIRQTPWATNHQLGVEWPRHGRISATIERAQILSRAFDARETSAKQLAQVFARKPMYSSNYRIGFGTVFNTVYRPRQKSVTLNWGKDTGGTWNLDTFHETTINVEYTDRGSRVMHATEQAHPMYHPVGAGAV